MTSMVDLAAVRTAFRRVSGEVCDLVETAPDPGTAVPGSEWSVGDVAAHLAIGTEVYVGYATGAVEPFFDVTDIAGGSLARSSAARLGAEPERTLGALAERLRAVTSALLDATAGRDGDDPVVWNGEPIGLADMLGIGLGEYLLHGRDVARALSRDWAVGAGDARLVLAGALLLLPLLVDPVDHRRCPCQLRPGSAAGHRVTLTVDDGTLRVDPAEGQAVDCHVSADPVALLLVSYGRRSQWVPALTGKLLAWGRKPWLGLRLVRYLVTP